MYVTISPSYAIRNERYASFLIRVEKIISNKGNDFGAFSIPPFMGYILAHIGDMEFSRSIREIAKSLNVSPEAIGNFIGQLIENKECREFMIDGHRSVVLPPSTLVRSPVKCESNVFEEPGFDGSGEFDIRRPSFPVYANLMVTTNCTTDCIYCYANRSLAPVMPTGKILSLLDELHDRGTVNITLTGGDIFAHPDWRKILHHARTLGYKPYLSTKTPVSKDSIRFLRDEGYEEIQFSLDSASPDVLNKMINARTGYIGRVRDFLTCCSELGLDVLIRSVLTSMNASSDMISGTYGFLSSFSCVREWVMTPAFFSSYKKNDYSDLVVDNDDLVEAFEFSQRKDLTFHIGLNKISEKGYVLKRCTGVEEFVCKNQKCMGNTTCISILVNGDCSVCEMLYDNPEYLLGNVTLASVSDIWNSEKALDLYYVSNDGIPEESPCKGCVVFDKCRNDFGKRVCYLDIAKTGHSRHFPDPRCPMAEDTGLLL